MGKQILRVTEIWRADTEMEAEQIIAAAEVGGGELTKKMTELKVKKSKGEIIAQNYKVTIQVDFAGQFDEPYEDIFAPVEYSQGDEEYSQGDEEYSQGDEEYSQEDEEYSQGDEEYSQGDEEYSQGDEDNWEDD